MPPRRRLAESGSPSRSANSSASSGSRPAPSCIRSSSAALRCSRSASTRISGKVMSRRPAFDFGALKRMPCALVCSSASRTWMTLPSRSTRFQRSASTSPSRMPVNSATMAGTQRREPRSLATKAGHVLHDDHFAFGDLGRPRSLQTFLADQAVALGVAQRLGRGRDGHGRWCGLQSAAVAQRRVPSLNVERRQLLHSLGADVRHDLVLDQSAVALAGRAEMSPAASHWSTRAATNSATVILEARRSCPG